MGPALAAKLSVAAGLALAAVLAADAAHAAVVAVAHCRDGLVHGPYELHEGAPGGPLLAAGAFNEGEKTGTFVFWTVRGARMAVVPYAANLRNGTVALWHVPPRARIESHRRLEAPYRKGRLDGTVRAWYADGAPAVEARYAGDARLEVHAWSPRGVPLEASKARTVTERELAAAEHEVAAVEALVAQHSGCRAHVAIGP